MKMPLRILLIILCAAIIIAIPFTISAPNMLNDVKMELMNGEDDEDEIDFGRLFLSAAVAEETDEDIDLDAGTDSAQPLYILPIDFSVPPAPDPDRYTEEGYEDETITVKMSQQVFDEGTTIHIAYVTIKDASQMRTAVAHPDKLGSTNGKSVSKMAKENNAVVAINGDNYIDDPQKTTFEYRMTQKIRSKANRLKDILIIDDCGDFHLLIKSEGLKEFPDKLKKQGKKLINAYTFGPALVKDGALLTIDSNYGYNPNGREPRAAIGQTGPLSYVIVIVQAKDRSGKYGFSQHKLAELMYDIGCIQAFNLDGGNSAEMVFGERIIKGMPSGDERTLSDIFYFATAKP